MRTALGALLFIAAGSFGCAARLECTTHGGQAWRELRSPHFVVQTNLEAALARAEVEKMEQTRDALTWFFELPAGDDHLNVVMVNEDAALREFTTGQFAGWATRNNRDAQQLIVSSLPSGISTHTHELAHYFSSFRRASLPRWFEEGLASYFETTQLIPVRRAKVGLVQENRRQSAFALGLLPLERLWRWELGDGTSPDEVGRLYATAWAWVHFLMNEERVRLQQFLGKLANNLPPREAFEQVFSAMEQLRLIDRLEDYVAHTKYQSFTIELPPTGTVRTERELSPAEVHLLRLKLWKSPEPLPDAEQKSADELLAAEKLDPKSFEVQLQRAKVAGTEVALAERFPLRFEAQLAAAQALIKGKDLPQRLEHAQKAIELAPGSALSQLVFASALMESGRAKEAIGPALEAERLMPWNPNVQFTLAALAAVNKLCADVKSRLDHGRALLGESINEREKGFLDEELDRLGKACRQ